VIIVENPVVTDDRHILGLSLRDQHAVERVFVRSRPARWPCSIRMGSSRKPDRSTRAGNSAANISAPGNLPIRTFEDETGGSANTAPGRSPAAG